MDDEMASGGYVRSKGPSLPDIVIVGQADAERLAGRYVQDLMERYAVAMGSLTAKQTAGLINRLAAAFAHVVVTVDFTSEEG